MCNILLRAGSTAGFQLWNGKLRGVVGELADRWLKRLPSVQMAREFVDGVVMPRVRSGEAIVIVTRQVKLWGIGEEPGVVLYSAGQARAAYLTPGSLGGRAILDYLGEG